MNPLLTRRRLLGGGLAFGAAAFFTPGVFAEELARTPSMTEGPFYPPRLLYSPSLTMSMPNSTCLRTTSPTATATR